MQNKKIIHLLAVSQLCLVLSTFSIAEEVQETETTSLTKKAAKSDKKKPVKKLSAIIKKGKYKGLTATASSNFAKSYTPDQAFDEDFSTAWIPRKFPCWVQIDLGEEKIIGKIVWNGDRVRGYRHRIPETYRFTASVTGEFTKDHIVLAGAEGNHQNKKVELVFEPVKTRYVRMEIYRSFPEPNWQPNIDEIEILPPPYQEEKEIKQ